MTVPTVSCSNCGKDFTTDDLRGTSCRYCGTVLAHHARAAEQVAVINQMMADRNGNGIPDAYEGLIANAQANAMNQAFGVSPYGQPPMANAMNQPFGMAPHGYGQPPMMGGPGYGVHLHAVHMQHATRAMTRAMIIVFVSLGLVTLLTVLGIVFWLVTAT